MRIPLRMRPARTANFSSAHFTVAFSIAYLVAGIVGIASALARVEPLTYTVANVRHELAWSHIALRWTGLGETRLASTLK